MPRQVWLRLGVWAVFLVALRLFVIPAETADTLEPAALRRAAFDAQDWMQRVLRADGSYLYSYDAGRDVVPQDYNEVRHAGVTMALFQAAGRSGSAGALAGADEAVGWMLDRLHRRDGWAALLDASGSRAKLGGTALMVVALAERRLATGDTRHDDEMRELGRFLAAMQRPDGGFHVAWDVGRGEPDRTGSSRYFPGEALWALALLHEAFEGEGWDRHARAASLFITTRRDAVEGVSFPPLNDHWAAYGLAEMAEWGLRDEEVEYARRLAARFGLLIRLESQREHGLLGGPGRLIRGREARAAALGTWVEGMAALGRLAASDPRMSDLRPLIEERLAVGAAILADRQIDDEEAARYARPDLVRGAWVARGETRMDDQQHALSGLLFAAELLEGDAGRLPAAPAPGRSS